MPPPPNSHRNNINWQIICIVLCVLAAACTMPTADQVSAQVKPRTMCGCMCAIRYSNYAPNMRSKFNYISEENCNFCRRFAHTHTKCKQILILLLSLSSRIGVDTKFYRLICQFCTAHQMTNTRIFHHRQPIGNAIQSIHILISSSMHQWNLKLYMPCEAICRSIVIR